MIDSILLHAVFGEAAAPFSDHAGEEKSAEAPPFPERNRSGYVDGRFTEGKTGKVF